MPLTFSRQFPLADYEGKLDGERWRLNITQEEHARNMLVEVPELSKLRYSLCPAKMSDTQFWNIYFLLLRNKGIDLSDQLQAAQLRLASPPVPKTPSVRVLLVFICSIIRFARCDSPLRFSILLTLSRSFDLSLSLLRTH